MPELERVTLVVGSGDRVFSKALLPEQSPTEWWSMSSPIPGAILLSSIEIFHRVWIILVRTDASQYQLFRTVDLQNYELVHTHPVEIYQIHFLDDGLAIFVAEDGIFVTVDAGRHWSRVCTNHLDDMKKIHAVRINETEWNIFAYTSSKRVYRCDLHMLPPSRSLGWEESFGAADLGDLPYSPLVAPSDWEVVFDASSCLNKWYPAIACNPLAIFVGAGNELWRSTDCGDTWYRIAVVNGAVKDLVVSDQSGHAELMMIVETPDGVSTIQRSFDLGDSFVTEVKRIEPIVSVQSVIPTSTSNLEISYVVLGQRTETEVPQYRIIEGGGT